MHDKAAGHTRANIVMETPVPPDGARGGGRALQCVTFVAGKPNGSQCDTSCAGNCK